MEQKFGTVESLLDTLNEATKLLRNFQSVLFVQTRVYKNPCMGVFFSIVVLEEEKLHKEDFSFHYESKTGEPFWINKKEIERLNEFIQELQKRSGGGK